MVKIFPSIQRSKVQSFSQLFLTIFKKKCDVVVKIFPSIQRSKVQSFSQLFLTTDEMDGKTT
jgi:hypothetical protein